jgi:dipeptidyl aminopeptidase/acylaminoacyl peptidase
MCSKTFPMHPGERQRLDIYAPTNAAGSPVLVYVPGGGFVGGDKRAEDGFYANIGYYFAQHGILVLIMNYRLAPDHPWPAGGEDVGRAVGWAREHAAAHGGDPGRIAVFGQSAGASHVLTWLFDPVLTGAKPVSAVVVSSGTYRVAGNKVSPNVKAYFGSDCSQYDARSPITHVRRTSIPILLTVSEFDPPFLASSTFELAIKLTDENGRAPQLRWLAATITSQTYSALARRITKLRISYRTFSGPRFHSRSGAHALRRCGRPAYSCSPMIGNLRRSN